MLTKKFRLFINLCSNFEIYLSENKVISLADGTF